MVHPGVPTYAIVDDDSDMLPEQMPRYVKTGYELGLEGTHVERLAALLTGREIVRPPRPVAVLAPRFAQTLRGAAPCQEGPPRDAAELGARYARRDAERRAGKAKAG
ncbi:hypothetical protein SAMN04487843_105113 [Methylobacterium sp. ap11]|uniref:hypothetical protein n=1 Tax=Methylobacterium sp. ap11 TaxID=1761799 RepID=UPI0008CD4146|nr:hypothetical protein [Methylobacterium sp. ap11]SEO94103.1 hypothetical protein SAMN04487843_105113 [Methylobacterium sp. ap11]